MHPSQSHTTYPDSPTPRLQSEYKRDSPPPSQQYIPYELWQSHPNSPYPTSSLTISSVQYLSSLPQPPATQAQSSCPLNPVRGRVAPESFNRLIIHRSLVQDPRWGRGRNARNPNPLAYTHGLREPVFRFKRIGCMMLLSSHHESGNW